jgi:hypothetical protein
MGKKDHAITFITCYRSCKGNITKARLGSTFHRSMNISSTDGHKSPNPWNICLSDLKAVVRPLQQKRNAILVMMDASEVLESRGALAEWASRLDLQDLHKIQPAPLTYIGSKHCRIDYIFGCNLINNYTVAAGALSYIDGPQSDHRGLFVDLDL